MANPRTNKTNSMDCNIKKEVESPELVDIEAPYGSDSKPNTVLLPTVSSSSVNDSSSRTKDYPKQEEEDEGNDAESFHPSQAKIFRIPTCLIALLIVALGAGTCMAILLSGISHAREEQENQFTLNAIDLVKKIQGSLADYVTAALWIHNRCRSREFTRRDFRQTYEYLIASGLEFQAAQFYPNISHDERPDAEEEARQYYAEYYPDIDYPGFVGLNFDNSTCVEPRLNASYYMPVHYVEPVVGNEKAIDLDLAASGSRRQTVLYCIETGKPALTGRLQLVQEKDADAYGVLLMSPGVNLTDQADIWPRDLASIVLRIPHLLQRSVENQGEPSSVYIFDKTDISGHPLFLGGAQIVPRDERQGVEVTFRPEISIQELRTTGELYFEEDVQAANKIWTVCVVDIEGTHDANILFVLIGSITIALASVFLALGVYLNARRVEQLSSMKAAADAEKASLILENAKEAAEAERELNDFIAHEVRNPISAAMSACSFVRAAVNDKQPLGTEELVQNTRDDVDIIDNSLAFVNDLLRNMLDMHRSCNNQLTVNLEPTDLLHDVIEPVGAMLHQRSQKVNVSFECADRLMVMTDRLRLKQVLINLGRNSIKFVQEGFVCLRATVHSDTGNVVLSVEDSGPGISQDRRELLFSKFQESLDSLHQGTGVGLFLCKNLVDLLGGKIRLDLDYDSGIPGRPGTKFVIDLGCEPLDPSTLPAQYHHMPGSDSEHHHGDETSTTQPTDTDSQKEDIQEYPTSDLPKKLEVLFVDDDPILRKLFARTVKRVAPAWNIREAASGEAAIRLCETENFDLIFMDMYMASVEKQLLGTETIIELRNKGITSRICGLSANDKEVEFLEAGADAFVIKPFACETQALKQELRRVLYA